MALKSGSYTAKVTKKVVVWPASDKDGDGELLWEDNTDRNGTIVGRSVVKDQWGNDVREYLPPDGFENRPGYDHTDNYVMVDGRGRIMRQPNGEAICLAPGQAIVLNPDGSIERLSDEYAQYLFSTAHDVLTNVED